MTSFFVGHCYRSLLPIFHDVVILPCISDHIKKGGIILGILVQSDTVNDLILFVDRCELILWCSDFALYI